MLSLVQTFCSHRMTLDPATKIKLLIEAAQVSITDDVLVLFDQLIDWSMRESDAPTRTALVVQIALLTNKWLLPRYHSNLLDAVKELRQILDTGTQTSQDLSPLTAADIANNCLRTLFYLCKAAILRMDPSSTTLLDHTLSLLAHPRHGPSTARGFSILAAPDEILIVENFVVIRLLHKQRLFSYCIPLIAEHFQKASKEQKSNYLVALAGLLQHMPTEVIMPQLDSLLPLLLQSIDLPDPDVKFASLHVMMVTLVESPKSVEGHISGLINRLIRCLASPPPAITSTQSTSSVVPGQSKDMFNPPVSICSSFLIVFFPSPALLMSILSYQSFIQNSKTYH